MDICVKYVKFSSVINLVHPVAEEELGLMLPYSKKHFSSMKGRLHIDALSKSDKKQQKKTKDRMNAILEN